MTIPERAVHLRELYEHRRFEDLVGELLVLGRAYRPWQVERLMREIRGERVI